MLFIKKSMTSFSCKPTLCILYNMCYSVLLSLPMYVEVCECSKGFSLAPSHSKADLRRASVALSERDLFCILVPEQCLGPFQRSGAPWGTHIMVPLPLHMPTTEWSNTLSKETFKKVCVREREKKKKKECYNAVWGHWEVFFWNRICWTTKL